MNPIRRSYFWAVLVLIALVLAAAIAHATRPHPNYYGYPPVGIHFQISEDFYRALNEQGNEKNSKLTTDASEDYLNQIAIATRYTVETNLAILKQQERIIQLLESLGGKLPAEKPKKDNKAP